MLPLLRLDFTGKPDAWITCLSGLESAGRKRTSAMAQRAVLRLYLDGLETKLRKRYPKGSCANPPKVNLVRFADDFVRHEARYVHGARAPTANRRAVSPSS